MRILFITATRIGDAVLSTGVLNWLVTQYPEARFTIACGRPAAPLFTAFPKLERLLIMDKQRFSLHWLKLWASCAFNYWDIVVDLRGSGTAWFLLAGKRIRWTRDSDRHRVEAMGDLLKLQPPPSPHLWIAAEHERRAEALIPPGAPVLGIGPTANWRGKEWPADRFADLIARLTAPNGMLPQARVAMFGAKSERAAAMPVIEAVPAARRIDLVGTAELPVVAACLRRCVLYIGNDSGLMHMAAAVGTPTLGLFGPGNVARYAPWGKLTAVARTTLTPIELMVRPDFNHQTTGSLMDSLDVETVVTAAHELYRRSERSSA